MKYTKMIQKLEAKHGDLWQYMMQRDEVQQELVYVQWKENQPGETPEYTYRYAEERIDRVANYILCPANVKVGDGVTVHLWSDAHAATIIKVTKCSVTVQYDTATLDPNWKPEWIAGGFAGHCVNQDEQTYTYERNPKGRIETYRWSNKYGSYGTPGNLRLTKGRHEFYDYNF